MHLKLIPAQSAPMPKDRIKIASIKSEKEDSETPLQPYEILSYPADYTLELLVDKWAKDEIKSPRLQRRYIWPIARASKLIESFLLGLPVPPIFVYQDREDNSLLIVDGHQRIRSIAYFFSGWFGEPDDPKREIFRLTGLNVKSPFADVDFGQLQTTDPGAINRLKNSVLRAFIMKQIHPADDTSILEIFERLNTGGMIAQGQEIRNCVYEGTFNELLKKLNKNDDWRKIVGGAVEDRRMRDVELILRFLALFYDVKSYDKPLKTFLNNFMRANRRAPVKPVKGKQKEFDEKMETFDALFTQTAKAVVKYLGPKPFHIRRGLNAAVFDSVFTAFGRHIDEIDKAPKLDHIRQVKANFQKLLENDEYQAWVSASTTDKDVVPARLKKADQVLFD